MSFSAICGIIAGVIFAISAGLYNYDVYKKRVTASVGTFFMFSVINASQLVALVSEHVWHVVPFTVVGLITSVMVCIFAWRNKKIYFELADEIGLTGAVIGLIAWFLTDNAALNVYILTVVNLLIFVPLIIKTFKHPNYETMLPWRLNLLASLFLLLTVNSAAAVVWVVPLRQFGCSLALNIGLLKRRQRQ